jgi:type I restriction enzyme M protein
VRLPKGVFSPYTSISTNILFFEKGKNTEEIWFFEHPYPEGYKSYSRSKPLTIQEFDLEKKWWNHRRGNEYAWKVTAGEIAAQNYNLDCKNPHEVEIDIGDPAELMAEFLELSQQVKEIQNALKSELIQALGDGK